MPAVSSTTLANASESLLVHDGTLITPLERIEGGSVGVHRGRIVYVGPGRPSGRWEREIDANGMYVLPGFLDLQVNGSGGHDFMSGDSAALVAVAAMLPRYGVTGFLATVGTAARPLIIQALSALARGGEALLAHRRAAALLGIHLEGPYISHERKGAHDPAHIRPFDHAEWAEFLTVARTIRMVTLAPEVPQNLQAIPHLVGSGVSVAVGHTDATYEQTLAAVAAGASCATHAFNGMRGFHHREPGVVGALLASDGLPCGIIADGVHVHPAALRVLFRAKGPDGIYLVTDASSVAGLAAGRYEWWGRQVDFDGVAPRLTGGGSLAGSGLDMNLALRNAMRFMHTSLEEAVTMATLTPARVLGLAGDRGRLAIGLRADLVLLNQDLRVVQTLVAGESVYEQGDCIPVEE